MGPRKNVANNQKNQQHEMQDRRRMVSNLYLRGLTQCEIAEQVGVTQATVSTDLKFVREEWQKSAIRDFGARQSEELARIDQIEREAWAAWERSKLDAESKSKKKEERTEGVVTTTQRTKKGQVGDPRFLAQVTECIEKRLKIFGVLDLEERLRKLEQSEK